MPRHLFEHCLRARHKADINLKTKVEVVRSLKLFRQFGDTPLREIATNMKVRELNEGDTLFERGAPNDCLHIVQQGGLSLRVPVAITSSDMQPSRGLQQSTSKEALIKSKGDSNNIDEDPAVQKNTNGVFSKIVEVLIVSPHHYCGIGSLDLNQGAGYLRTPSRDRRRNAHRSGRRTTEDDLDIATTSAIHEFTGTAIMAQTKVISVPRHVMNHILANYTDGPSPEEKAIPVCRAALKYSLKIQQDLIFQRIAFSRAHPEMNIPLISINQQKALAIRRHGICQAQGAGRRITQSDQSLPKILEYKPDNKPISDAAIQKSKQTAAAIDSEPMLRKHMIQKANSTYKGKFVLSVHWDANDEDDVDGSDDDDEDVFTSPVSEISPEESSPSTQVC